MSDYISREKLAKKATHYEIAGFKTAKVVLLKDVMEVPAADVRPVVRGKWIKSKRHVWEKNRDGTVNEFAWDRGIHNGPFCTICGETPCIHCEPDYDEKDCEKEHYICPFCGRIEMDFQPFCNCGARMEDTDND